jgi:hypothetical protein
MGKEGFLFYNAFDKFYNVLKLEQIIEDFSLTLANLEQIFLFFSKMQKELREQV